jgi:hypothetical protein
MNTRSQSGRQQHRIKFGLPFVIPLFTNVVREAGKKIEREQSVFPIG